MVNQNADMNTLSGRYITTSDGVPIAVFEAGNPDGQPIIFLSGFGFSHTAFRLQFRSSLATSYRLIALDLRGHGDSGKPLDRSAYINAQGWAGDLQAALTHCNANNAIIVGWSFGAMVFSDWLRCYGLQNVRGFVSVGSNAGLIAKTPEQREKGQKAIAALQKRNPDFQAELAKARAFVRAITHKPLPRDLADMMVVSNMKLNLVTTKMIAEKTHENDDLKGNLTCPTLFILGEHDAGNTPQDLHTLAGELSNASVKIMENVGHTPFLEDADQFNQLLHTFVSQKAVT